VRFTHDKINQFITVAHHVFNTTTDWQKKITDVKPTFTNYVLQRDKLFSLLTLNPVFKFKELKLDKASYFVCSPGHVHAPHSDDWNFGINYSIKILDNDCQTSWFDEKELLDNYQSSQYATDRIFDTVKDFKKSQHKPLKVATFQPGEVALLNTKSWHDFDNSKSTNERIILTIVSSDKSITYDQAKEILFQ
jgi:hypothetical protein